jgi:two-component system sensor histidine kinase/response regulator
MGERIDRSGIVADLSVLYELSLSVGTSLDLYRNCDVFLTTLMARKNLSWASVWIDSRWLERESGSHYRMVLGLPTFRGTAATLNHDHPVATRLKEEGSYQCVPEDPDYGAITFEPGLKGGTCLVLRLGDLGFLKLHRRKVDVRGTAREINQLSQVLEQFTVSLQGCLAHGNLRGQIEERIRSEQALADSEGRYRWVTDHVVDVIWTMDLNGQMTYVSPAVERFRGVSMEEAGKEILADAITPESMSRVREAISRVWQGADPEHDKPTLEVEFYTADGGTVWGEVSARVIRDDNGAPVEVMGVTRDTTARKRAQEALVKAHDEALAATRSKSEFLANMSHEIRTPLSGVIGMADLLSRTEMNDRQRYMVDVVRKSSRSLRALLNNILDLSKIEAGRLELDPRDCNLRNLVEDVAAVVMPAALSRGLDLHVMVGPEVPSRLVCDSERLRQVLTNLAANAVKFTEEGHVKISVTGGEISEGALTVFFEVADTGIGIAPDKQQLVFETFRQADGTTSRRYGGTGLGLPISSLLVEAMGGKIDLESAPGQGSSFRFGIELACADPCRGMNAGALQGTRVVLIGGTQQHAESLGALVDYWAGSLDHVADPADPEVDAAEALMVVASCSGDHHDCDGLAGRTAQAARGRPCVVFVQDPVCPAGQLPGVVALPWPSPRRDLLAGLSAGCPVRDVGPDPDVEEAKKLAGKRVLIAEDNEYNRQVLSMMLEEWGCRVETANDGEKAVAVVLGGGVDLVLMDVQMPVVDGLEAARRIRALPGPESATPIIAATAHAFPADRDRCLKAGMDDYLSKPVDEEALLGAMTGLLSGSGQARAASAASGGIPDGKAGPAERPAAPAGTDLEAYLKTGNSLQLSIARKLAPRFAEDTHRRLQVLRELQAAGDGEELAREAHAIAGAAATIGAIGVESISREIMDRAAGDVGAMGGLIDELQQSLEATLSLLQTQGDQQAV